ncbi:MAG: hypothetical protein ACFFBD_04820 [Candidatus Hodarchaeota archaeon]
MSFLHIIQQIISEEIISYEITIFAQLKHCNISFENYVHLGEQSILEELQIELNTILTLAKQGQQHGVVLAILLLQGKLALLQFNINKAQSLFQRVKNESKERGFELFDHQCTIELNKLRAQAEIATILEMSEKKKGDFRKQQTQEVFDYLKGVALQLQHT